MSLCSTEVHVSPSSKQKGRLENPPHAGETRLCLVFPGSEERDSATRCRIGLKLSVLLWADRFSGSDVLVRAAEERLQRCVFQWRWCGTGGVNHTHTPSELQFGRTESSFLKISANLVSSARGLVSQPPKWLQGHDGSIRRKDLRPFILALVWDWEVVCLSLSLFL